MTEPSQKDVQAAEVQLNAGGMPLDITKERGTIEGPTENEQLVADMQPFFTVSEEGGAMSDTDGLLAGAMATRMHLVALDMRQLALGLEETMPGKMDALTMKLDMWRQSVTDVERYLRGIERRATNNSEPES